MWGRRPNAYKKMVTALKKSKLDKQIGGNRGAPEGAHTEYFSFALNFVVVDYNGDMRLMGKDGTYIANLHSDGRYQVYNPMLLQQMLYECNIKFDLRILA